MGSSVLEKKMHYPVMTERQIAARWKVSLKTLRRWRLDSEGPIWHKLFHHVRYHQADILEFERQSAHIRTHHVGDGLDKIGARIATHDCHLKAVSKMWQNGAQKEPNWDHSRPIQSEGQKGKTP